MIIFTGNHSYVLKNQLNIFNSWHLDRQCTQIIPNRQFKHHKYTNAKLRRQLTSIFIFLMALLQSTSVFEDSVDAKSREYYDPTKESSQGYLMVVFFLFLILIMLTLEYSEKPMALSVFL